MIYKFPVNTKLGNKIAKIADKKGWDHVIKSIAMICEGINHNYCVTLFRSLYDKVETVSKSSQENLCNIIFNEQIDGFIRCEAGTFLGKVGDKSTVNLLGEKLSDKPVTRSWSLPILWA